MIHIKHMEILKEKKKKRERNLIDLNNYNEFCGCLCIQFTS